ncbi:MAG: hypothetical protein NVS4B3_16260 [Gemmatimonadaceae bacterium]
MLVASACHSDSGAGPAVATPAIDSIAPRFGGAGSQIKIYGNTFATAGVTVAFGTTPSPSASVVSATLVQATVPQGLTNGTLYDVQVTNTGGGSATKVAAFKAVVPPVVDSVRPNRGTTGTVVGFFGRQFSVDSVNVFYGTLKSLVVQQQPGVLYATVPAGVTAGTSYDVRIVNKDGVTDTLVAGFKAIAPIVTRVNGVTKPSGLVGMTVLIEGDAFGDLANGKVFFTGTGGALIQAVIVDPVNDWNNNYIVTTVPAGITSPSQITVQTATGTSVPVTFTLVSGSTFSPSTINWTATTAMPQSLQGLGAAFVPSANINYPANYVYTVGGAADSTNVATTAVFRSSVQSTGAVGAWTTLAPLPVARAYHAMTAASVYTASFDTTTTTGYLYALGGIDALGKTVSTVYVARLGLDGTTGPWTATTPLPAPVHSASAVMFRGYIYFTGGADSLNNATALSYRAPVKVDGTLGAWQAVAPLPTRSAFHALLNFGPYVYIAGGDSGVVAPVLAGVTGTELSSVSLARINLRDGTLPALWTPLTAMTKGRSKHGTLAAGGSSLFTTSGVYSGAAGSSENIYTTINSDGTINTWAGATGSNTIGTLLGYDLYNQATVGFVDAGGKGHVMVLGGAKRQFQGRASAAVVFY